MVEKLTSAIGVIANGAPGGAWKTRTGRSMDQGMDMTRKWLMVGTISVMPQPQVVVGIMIGIREGEYEGAGLRSLW
jgi:hypothetical protein